jgi:hypothetical protein
MNYLIWAFGIVLSLYGIFWQQELAGILGVAAIFMQIWRFIDNGDRKLLDYEIQRVYEDLRVDRMERDEQQPNSSRTNHEFTLPLPCSVQQARINDVMKFPEFGPSVIGMQMMLSDCKDAG